MIDSYPVFCTSRERSASSARCRLLGLGAGAGRASSLAMLLIRHTHIHTIDKNLARLLIVKFRSTVLAKGSAALNRTVSDALAVRTSVRGATPR